MIGQARTSAAVLAVLMASVTLGQPSERVVEGVIDSVVGLAFWPSLDRESNKPGSPDGFVVHLVPEENPDSEIAHPCGEWFLLPPEPQRYMWWLEGPDLISPRSAVLTYSRVPANDMGGRRVVAPVVPAGTVALAPDTVVPPSASLRFLHVQSGFARRSPQAARSDPLMMPVGTAIATLFDPSLNQYVSLSRPVAIQQGKETTVWLRPPPKLETDLLVRLEHPETNPNIDLKSFEAVLVGASDEPLQPDVVVHDTWRTYLVWYGLSVRRVALRVESSDTWLPGRDFVLRPGRVEYEQLALRRKPAIDVSLILPVELSDEVKRALVLDRPSATTLASVDIPDNMTSVRLWPLPPAEVTAVLMVGDWEFQETVNLSDGSDGAVVFQPKPIHIAGTVMRGKQGIPAEVAFSSSNDEENWTRVDTNAEGRYELVLYRPDVYETRVRTLPDGEPRFDASGQLIDHDTTLDFHFSAAELRLRVVSAETGQPVDGAEIQFHNQADDNTASGRPLLADNKGEAVLPMLKSGHVIVGVRAEGYRPTTVERDVSLDSDPEKLDVALEPFDETVTLRVLLPTEEPASGASVGTFLSLESPPLWSGQCDTSGLCQVPTDVEAPLLVVRHPLASFNVLPWPPPPNQKAPSVRLAGAAPPLNLALVHASGDAARGGRIVVWAHGQRISGPILHWLLGAPAAANTAGLVHLAGLPQGAVGVLAWQPQSPAEAMARAGGLDHLRTAIPYPWPSTVLVTVLE